MDFQQRYRQIQTDLASGQLGEPQWYEQIRELVEEAYLTSGDPWAQSGSVGDAEHWERRRRVIAEAIDRDGTFLDVGCASGVLMETLVEWAKARGYNVEPYGLDISPKLATVARSRLPAWADRIYVGNIMTWQPPRRFDYVRTELVYVPDLRQQQLVTRLLERVVAPDGRLIICAYRPRGARDADPLADLLHSWGFTVSGEVMAIDSTNGGVATRVIWLDAAG